MQYQFTRRQAKVTTGQNWGASSYTQRNIYYYCNGTNSTTWAGSTLGTITTYSGKKYYARVYTPQVKLNCKA